MRDKCIFERIANVATHIIQAGIQIKERYPDLSDLVGRYGLILSEKDPNNADLDNDGNKDGLGLYIYIGWGRKYCL